MFLPCSVDQAKLMKMRMEKAGVMNRIRNRCRFVAMAFGVWWLFFVYRFVSGSGGTTPAAETYTELQEKDTPHFEMEQTNMSKSSYQRRGDNFAAREALSKVEDGIRADVCAGRYIYVYDLPRKFHEGILDECDGPYLQSVILWSQMCNATVNMGFGLPMEDLDGVLSSTGWYATNLFLMEIIFDYKIKHYQCLTVDSSEANAIFVPFYSGMEVMPHLWGEATISHRDAVPNELANWLTSQPEWSRMYGHDHFMAAGRMTYDFRRRSDDESDWGNRLLLLDAVRNITTLIVEADPWDDVDVAIPWPTYFHPSTDQEILDWQDRVSKIRRNSLFCFAGAPRPNLDISIRGQIMAQCKESEHCSLLECGDDVGKCHSPANVMRLFQESHFCLQPVGDAYTRRSLFDAILAGCIPVLFHPHSAYNQYRWFLPENNSSYSVFIDEENVRSKNASIEQVLRSYSAEDIEAKRNVVVSLIPGILYSNPLNNDMSLKDAFDISIEGVLERIREYQRRVEEERKLIEERKLRVDPGKLALTDVHAAKARLDALLRGGERRR